MTLRDALELLREMNEKLDRVYGLVPDRIEGSPVWDIVDTLARDYVVIARHNVPEMAIIKAYNKIMTANK